jgi:hypothetical protein
VSNIPTSRMHDSRTDKNCDATATTFLLKLLYQFKLTIYFQMNIHFINGKFGVYDTTITVN